MYHFKAFYVTNTYVFFLFQRIRYINAGNILKKTGFLWACISMEIWERMERIILFFLTGTLSDVKASNKTLISLETKSAALHNEEHLV